MFLILSHDASLVWELDRCLDYNSVFLTSSETARWRVFLTAAYAAQNSDKTTDEMILMTAMAIAVIVTIHNCGSIMI